MLKRLKIFLKLVCLFGLGVWALGAICSLLPAGSMVSEHIRFPLNNINDMAVDSKGRIYTESGFSSRLQVYSPSGKFLRGWFSGSFSGKCRLELDNNDYIHVYTARGARYGNHYVYDEMGKLIKKTDLQETESHKYKSEANENVDHLGNRYQFGDRYFFAKIVRTNPSGDIDLVIGNPLYLKLFEPTFVVISVVIALILLSLIELQKRIHKKKKQTKDISAEDSIHQ